jgi:NadR type nicotinamide-nucleotide adenylyltransferase
MSDNTLYRIALIGPESTGKSTLAQDLADHYQSIHVPEFSRAYMESLKRKYEKPDVIYCIAAQFESERKLISRANRILFVDTESIMGSVWMEDVYNTRSDLAEKLIRKYPYDLYLLCEPDLPFEEDPVRENPLRRDHFFNRYKDELIKRNFNFDIVSGIDEQRLKNAIAIIESKLVLLPKHVPD